jgi:glutamate synthase domain-containing protein 1/glutamate synthase domain-containing protein 3
MNPRETIERILRSRRGLQPSGNFSLMNHQNEAEGGCGVIGIACSEKIAGRHLLRSLNQMRNRGNGKGGGVAIVGLVPEEMGVSREVLDRDYLLTIAILDDAVLQDVEDSFIHPVYEVDHHRHLPHMDNYSSLSGLDVRPPEVHQYFARLKPQVVDEFIHEQGLGGDARRRVEDEIVYQNSYRLNSAFYASTGDKKAFVLSHGKNMMVIKMVGFGDDVITYYMLEDLHAHVWIGHHRYPTKGRVWHPGGAHPFVGLNEALVHNGDFANYTSIAEYLSQRDIYPLFLTDTEVSVLVFDLLDRVYDYPLEYVIETLAPTTERDFTLLPPDKQRIYEQLQLTHMHASPDGPWFFLIAQSDHAESHLGRQALEGFGPTSYRLIGITDTSMLRPQVFAWQQSGNTGPAIGFAASEKQAIDAALESLAAEDRRFWSRADRYWNARGGSHTDGGAFIFSVYPDGNGSGRLVCTDKFGRQVQIDQDQTPFRADSVSVHPSEPSVNGRSIVSALTGRAEDAGNIYSQVVEKLPTWSYSEVIEFLGTLRETTEDPLITIETLTRLIDRRYPTGQMRRSSLLSIYDSYFADLVETIKSNPSQTLIYSTAAEAVSGPAPPAQAVVVDGRGYASEGPGSLALEIVRLVQAGFRRLIVVHTRGHRFLGSGLGAGSQGVRIDIYGSPGDYLASGIDGLEIHVHANGQDQLAQILKSGKLVVHGDVGQTFMYAAKGGQAYVLGNAAGRPLINAVGKPRVVINGTCLDYLAESFMAGDPTNGGGFVILNGLAFNGWGDLAELETPYPGGNLFSLASGGAIYLRDPHEKVAADQLNGGEITALSEKDWQVMLPILEENERLFGISMARLLEVDGKPHAPEQVYRKVQPRALRALQAEEAWVHKNNQTR